MSCRVKFLNDWRECMRDDILTVRKTDARELVEQGIAEYVESKEPKEKKFIKEKKEIRGAPKDRMLKRAPITK